MKYDISKIEVVKTILPFSAPRDAHRRLPMAIAKSIPTMVDGMVEYEQRCNQGAELTGGILKKKK